MYGNASELYNEYLEIYLDEYKALSDAQKRKLDDKYDPINLFLETYNYNIWFENEKESIDKEEWIDKEESIDKAESTDVPPMPPLEGDEEEVRKGKGIKILTPNKLLPRVHFIKSL